MSEELTRTERAALKEIWRRFSMSKGPTRTGDLATALGMSPATATATVKRLADRDLLRHEPYKGAELTGPGKQTAMKVIRRHRIVERFLSDMLGYSWSDADRLAPTFEHDLPEEVEQRLYEALHQPATCPHGFPIPTLDNHDVPDMPPLYDLSPGDVAVIALPGSMTPEMVSFVEELGLIPGAEVEMRAKQPFGGPIVVKVNGSEKTLGERIARQLRVLMKPSETTDTKSD